VSTVYSTRFGSKHDLIIGDPLSYTVPAGKIAVLRDIDAYNGVITGNTVYLELVGAPNVIIWQDSWGNNETGWRDWRGRQVFYAGDEFSVYSTDLLDATMSGYLLDAP